MRKRKRLSILCFLIAFLFLSFAISEIAEYEKEKEYYKKFNHSCIKEETVDPSFNYPAVKEIDWNTVKGEDVVAWIDIIGIGASYPIVQSENNKDYLRKNPEGEYANSGSIILNTTNSSDFMDYNTIIFGHNMKNGTMFGKIREYLQGNAYETSPYIWIYTPTEKILYKIAATYKTDLSGEVPDTYCIDLNETEYSNWYNKQIALSEKEMEACEPNKMLTLSTCTTGIFNNTHRTILQATLVGRFEN